MIEGPTPAATIFALTVPFVWSNSLHTPCKGGVPVGGCTFGTSGSIVMMSPDRITVNRTSSLAHRYTPPGVLATSRPGPGLLASADAQIDSDGAVFFFQFVQQENLTVYHWEQQVTRILPRPCPLLAPS